MYTKYFFKLGDKNLLVDNLRQFLYSRFYLTTPANKVCSDVFDSSMISMITDYQSFNRLNQNSNVFANSYLSAGSILNTATYEQIGTEMNPFEIDSASRFDPDIKRLFYGVAGIDLCGSWDNIASVITKDKFIGWGHQNIAQNCFDYCKKQLQDVGKSMKTPWWGTKDKMNSDIYQLYLTEDVAGMKKGIQVKHFTKGVLYLKSALKSSIPVVAGVDDAPGSPNSDKVTDHFVVIVGMGSDDKGKYFLFYDNATSDKTSGTSDKNRLYCNCDQFQLKGTGDNSYARDSQYKSYTVTQIRETN